MMTRQGSIQRPAGWLMGVPLEVEGWSGSRPADPARGTGRFDPLGGVEPRRRSKGSPV
jgi:hypothetical protein